MGYYGESSSPVDERFVELLITRLHVDVNHAGRANQWTALHYAALACNEQLMHLLLARYGANPNILTNELWSPIYFVLRFGCIAPESLRVSLLNLLIEKGANLFLRTNKGWSCLHMAVQSEDEESLRVLFEALSTARPSMPTYEDEEGQDNKPHLINIKDNKGWSPLCLSLQRGYNNITRILIENGADVEFLHPSRRRNDRNNHNNNHTQQRTRQSSPLRVAVHKGLNEVVMLLLGGGADVNRQDNEGGGLTPVHCAIKAGHNTTLSMLLQHNANPHLHTKREWTPSHLAAKLNNREALSILLQHGADLIATTSNGNTPLSVAVQNNAVECVEFLLSLQGIASHSLAIPLANTLWRPLHSAGT